MLEKYSFLQLKKAAKKSSKTDVSKHRVAVVGDFATQHLSTAIAGYGYEEDIPLDLFDADYNQLDAQILNNYSELFQFEPQYVVLCMCTEKLYQEYAFLSDGAKENFAAEKYNQICCYWERILQGAAQANILQFNFVEIDDLVWGHYALKEKQSFLYQIKKLNFLLMEASSEYKKVSLLNINGIALECGLPAFRDDKFYYIAKMPISQKALPYIAGAVVDLIKTLNGSFKKCVIVDLDNTLWGGVIGDDGLESIEIGELGQGHAFTDFQIWLKTLKERGIILAVCSKNNDEVAKEPFLKHPEMVLKLDDFAVFVANWDDKASNIRLIQETLNIGMDSIVFIDDNPFERNVVKSMIADITVPELPEDPSQYVSYLKSCRLFETVSYSDADKKRTKQYKEEAKRKLSAKQYGSYEDYLVELDMMASAKPFDSFNIPRIAQLTQRSNQFNLRTVRYTEADIEKIAEDENYITLFFTLKDKFGDYGLISVVIMNIQEAQNAFIDTWLMSCRVLKRSMEEYIVNKIVAVARAKGCGKVIGEYKKTPKNAMVENIYEKMGFIAKGNGKFEVNVDDFKENQTFVMEDVK